MEKKMETTILGYMGTIRRIHAFIPSEPKISLGGFKPWGLEVWGLGV